MTELERLNIELDYYRIRAKEAELLLGLWRDYERETAAQIEAIQEQLAKDLKHDADR